MNLLFGMKDIGGANAVIPVALKAIEGGNNYGILYCDGVSYDRFKDSYPSISTVCDPEKVFNWLKPEAVITSTCTPNENLIIPIKFVEMAHLLGIPVVAVQDFWMSGMSVKWNIRPDKICVQDDLAKRLLLSYWEGYGEDDIVVTGQPAFDHLSGVDCHKARTRLASKLGLTEQWPIIHLSGGFKGTAEAVEWTVKSLNRSRTSVYLLVRYHPIMVRPDAPSEWRDVYEKCKHLPSTLKHGKVIDSSFLTSSEVNAGADIVIGVYSTLLVEACYLRKNCISIITPEARSYFGMETGNMLSEFPPAMLEACFSVSSEDALTPDFWHSLFSQNTLCSEQERNFVTDGNSAKRVLDVVSSVI